MADVPARKLNSGEPDAPGAYRVAEIAKETGGPLYPVVDVCCPDGCGIHAGFFTDHPTGEPASMKEPISIWHPAGKVWEGQLLNGVWTEAKDGAPVPDDK